MKSHPKQLADKTEKLKAFKTWWYQQAAMNVRLFGDEFLKPFKRV